MDCVVLGIILFAAIFVLAIFAGSAQAKQKERARQDYLRSLEQLKSDPNNASYRQTTLALGRQYSNLTRNKQGVTLFDEMALKNDIDAACAGAVSVQSGTTGTLTGTVIPIETVPRHLRFRVHAADRETGDETTFEIKAATVQEARAKANAAGYLVDSVELIGD